jgi:2-keto-4-pentenoate hydratase/2-oxohepta-3-ene-1,7-dioic acid hydratase in catechol pathway
MTGASRFGSIGTRDEAKEFGLHLCAMKIICIGRNYAQHAVELGNAIPEEPLFFLKPDSAVHLNKHPFYLPDWSNDIHYEVEVIVRINRLGKAIAPQFASKYYEEVGLGIDFTARDVQEACKAKGHPWERAKAFDHSAVVSQRWFPVTDFPAGIQGLAFQLKRNGEVVQNGNTRDMLFPVDDLIAHVSRYMTLKVGDLLYTGTPAGVGRVEPGDELEGFLEGESCFRVAVK